MAAIDDGTRITRIGRICADCKNKTRSPSRFRACHFADRRGATAQPQPLHNCIVGDFHLLAGDQILDRHHRLPCSRGLAARRMDAALFGVLELPP